MDPSRRLSLLTQNPLWNRDSTEPSQLSVSEMLTSRTHSHNKIVVVGSKLWYDNWQLEHWMTFFSLPSTWKLIDWIKEDKLLKKRADYTEPLTRIQHKSLSSSSIRDVQLFDIMAWCCHHHSSYLKTTLSIKKSQKFHNVLSNFMILCWALSIASLGGMCCVSYGTHWACLLDCSLCVHFWVERPYLSAKFLFFGLSWQFFMVRSLIIV